MNKKAKKFDYVLAVIFVFLVIITIYPFLNVLAISFNDSTDTIKNVNFIIPRKFTACGFHRSGIPQRYHMPDSSISPSAFF